MTRTVPVRSLTVKGERTRGMIVDTAATLMLNDGVAGTTIDGVCAAAGVGQSQVYHYFDDKGELVRAVIERQAELVFSGQEPHLAHIQGTAIGRLRLRHPRLGVEGWRHEQDPDDLGHVAG